ncbi:hypothetical protein [Rhodoblastus sp.]|uniref:hypothetical protein n=1 Tax=Rhodoblastus sp. TaxID=1962975 RepID=UPI0026212288|nr:hypothetical protein [Rhodoblastus sp.]
MRAQPVDRRIAELLNDPLTSLIIRADGVDRARLAAQLRRVAAPPRASAPTRFDERRSWSGLTRLPAVLCGACAP